MFRPLKQLGKNANYLVSSEARRSKHDIFSESFLDKAERMKLWHKENKQLFGPLIVQSKPKGNVSRKERTRRVLAPKASLLANEISPRVLFQETDKKSHYDTNQIEISSAIESKEEYMSQKENKIQKPANSIFQQNNQIFSQDRISRIHQVEIVNPHVKYGILSRSHSGIPSVIIRNLKLFPMMSNQKAYVVDNNSDDTLDDNKVLTIQSSNVNDKKLPSVTKILEQTMSDESRDLLEKWKKEKIAELGPEGFEKFYKAQLECGSKFHEILSKYMVSPHGNVSISQQMRGVWNSVSHVLKDIKEPKAIESHVVHPVLKYKGVIDCIATYQDKPTLIEWKKSDKPKTTLSATYDNPLQIAAYFGAVSHDPNYKSLNVKDALLVIAYTDGSPADVFHLNTDQIRQHWASWLSRLEKYWAKDENNQQRRAEEIQSEETPSQNKQPA